jgi:hypothetical protein
VLEACRLLLFRPKRNLGELLTGLRVSRVIQAREKSNDEGKDGKISSDLKNVEEFDVPNGN